MPNLLASLSSELAAATDTSAASVVQLQSRRRPVAGIVFETDHILAPGNGLDDVVAVRRADGQIVEGQLLGRHAATGLAVVRVVGLDAPVAASTADEPRPGHLAVAIGRTWSGGVFATLASVVVVGGPLRTSRTTEIARVVRIDLAPHGALTGGALVNGSGQVLGLLTAMAVRGTTVVIPTALAWAGAREVAAYGGAKQGFIGVSSMAVTLPPRQRAEGHDRGLLVTGVVPDGPADHDGILVGDVIVGLDGSPVTDPDGLLTLLRGARVGQTVALSIVRNCSLETLRVAVGERRR